MAAAALWTSHAATATAAADGGVLLRSTYTSTMETTTATARMFPVATNTLRTAAEETRSGRGRRRLAIASATHRVQPVGGAGRGELHWDTDNDYDDDNCRSTQQQQQQQRQQSLGRVLLNTAAAAAVSLSISLSGGIDLAAARPVGVNRPELLPESFTPVIDVAGFLTPQQEGRIAQDVTALEEETGFKLRVLAQNYPETPGLAVKIFWQVDDNTIVFVADPSMGNILNFNVGAAVDLNVPRSFWSRLAGKYGNIFYWREKGEDASIEAAVAAIGECLREPAGPRACAEIK